MGTGAFVNILFEKSLDFRRIHTAFPGFRQRWCYENGVAEKVAK
jgi:hypothetical protein